MGNTSIAGAKTVLLSRRALKTAERIAQSMTYFDLMSHPKYMDEFIRACFLPHTDLSLFPSVKMLDKCQSAQSRTVFQKVLTPWSFCV